MAAGAGAGHHAPWRSHIAGREGALLTRVTALTSTTVVPGGLALLVLEDGTIVRGETYGAVGQTLGEAVFATGMTGYQVPGKLYEPSPETGRVSKDFTARVRPSRQDGSYAGGCRQGAPGS